jgi:uncharacterized protein (DUF697 family)/predicted GTPase
MSIVGSLAKRYLPDFGTLAGMSRDAAQPNADAVAEGARAFAPVIWMIGKVQSGKSSIVHAITKSDEVALGGGFKACTRTARIFDFPEEAPVLRFLDTRGLGEAEYDPAEDLAFCAGRAHLLLAVARAMDPQQSPVLEAVRTVRQEKPDWPLIVALTSLHEGYAPGQNHPANYPFDTIDTGAATPAALPADLLRSLAHQRAQFSAVPGSGPIVFVPIDFTKDGDGYTPVDFGLDALAEAIVRVAPAAMVAALEAMPGLTPDPRLQQADPLIMGHAAAAAGGDLVPVAGAVAVSVIQARLLQRLSAIYGISWDKRVFGEFAAALGSGVAIRMLAGLGIRQLMKFIPVYGQTAGLAASAATSFAVTYALGKAAVYFLSKRRLGTHDPEGVARTYRQALQEAFRLAKERSTDAKP